MRVLLPLLCAAGCAFFGNAMAGSLGDRVVLLRRLQRDLERMRGWIAYEGMPLPEMLRRLSPSELGPFWAAIGDGLARGAGVAVAWAESVRAQEKTLFAPLAPETVGILAELGAALEGAREPAVQRRRLEETLERLRRMEREAAEAAGKKGSLYRALGALMGLAAAIVLW